MDAHITIGRDSQCTIMLSADNRRASRFHATIYVARRRLMYKDTSKNGTLINGRMVRQCTAHIVYGDTILIAGKYLLSWKTILKFISIPT